MLVSFISMTILTHSDAKALCLGMAQLIPIFLIALFVLDNAWIERSAEKSRREASKIFQEVKDLEVKRLDNDRVMKDAIKLLDKFSESLGSQSHLADERQKKVVEDAASITTQARTKLGHIEKEYHEAVERVGTASGKMAKKLQWLEAQAKASTRSYSRVIIATIILGMLGEVFALWGAVGLVDNVAVIACALVINIGIAGILSILAIDRLLIDASSRVLVLIRSAWVLLLASSVLATFFWIITSVQVKN